MNNNFKNCIEFIKAANKNIPSKVWNCTTPIVIAYKGKIQHFGTGTLFSIADYYFLVTAAHVFKQASKHNLSLGITGSQDDSFISLNGDSLVSSEGQYGSSSDPFDVGIHRISDEAASRIKKGKTFLRFNDIGFETPSSTGIYTLFGYPGVWSSSSATVEEKVKYKALQYTTHQFDQSTSSLSEYQERLHILLDGQIEQAFNSNAIPLKPADLFGNPTPITEDFRGISGCSVWMIGDIKQPINTWDNENPKLVAVQTGVYYTAKAIKATKWIAISTLLYNAFPELRPAMQLSY